MYDNALEFSNRNYITLMGGSIQHNNSQVKSNELVEYLVYRRVETTLAIRVVTLQLPVNVHV